MTNTSTCATTGTGPGSVLNKYSNYTNGVGAPTPPDVMQGASIPLSLDLGTCSGHYGSYAKVFIDWNQNGLFTDAGEEVYVSPSINANSTLTGSVVVPITALAGNTGIRVVYVETSSASSVNPCGTYSWGETEDYLINVTVASGCTGTPVAGNATAPSSVCLGTSFTLSTTGTTVATGISGNWQESTDGGVTWIDISGATSSSYTISVGINVTTQYRYWVNCANSNVSDTSNIAIVTVLGPTYAIYNGTSYTEDFENWIPRCSTNDLPSANWNNSPASGNNSWRRDDQGADGAWAGPTFEAYTPVSSTTAHSARFHSYLASSGLMGSLSFYVDMSAAVGTTRISFDHINTSGSDVLKVFISTDGGATEAQLGSDIGTSSAWTNKTFDIVSNSATTIIRLEATSDYGATDIGIDNFMLAPPPACIAPIATAATNLTQTTADANWDLSTGSFIVEYGPTATFSPTGTGATAGNANNFVVNVSNTNTITLTGLNAATNYSYVVRQDCSGAGNGFSANSNSINFMTKIVNDDASGAIALALGAGCTGAAYTNVGATTSTGEPESPILSTTNSAKVWFKFTAPSSGAVRVTTDLGAGTLTDTRITLFTTTNPTDYSTFTALAADDDNGASTTFGGAGPALSTLYANGLIAGNTYYVLVTGFSGTTAGTFCIAVDELVASMLSPLSSCTAADFQTPYGTATYTGIVSIVDKSGQLVALVKNPLGGPANAYTAKQTINSSGTVRNYNGDYYLDRNFNINNSAATNVEVTLFFTNTELDNLMLANPNTVYGMGVLKVTKVSNTNCEPDYTPDGSQVAIVPSSSGTHISLGYSFVNFTSPSFSNFYLGANAPLPIHLEYFKGKTVGATNELSWKASKEQNAKQYIVEHSADGKSFKKLGVIKAQNKNGASYKFKDEQPLNSENYYRLNMESFDGEATYSEIVKLSNSTKTTTSITVMPNPVKEQIKVSITGPIGKASTLSLIDVIGRVVYSQAVSQSEFTVDLHTLKAGVYLLQFNDGASSQVIKLVKE
ncbi:MAG TPA: GEVED domain-containing protein [Edaphocola sp.]|nr:GEVED domain-containing protein [Edaphocola sp.]